MKYDAIWMIVRNILLRTKALVMSPIFQTYFSLAGWSCTLISGNLWVLFIRIHALISPILKLLHNHIPASLSLEKREETNMLCAWTWMSFPFRTQTPVVSKPSTMTWIIPYTKKHLMYFQGRYYSTSANFLLTLNISCLLYNLPLSTTFSKEL